MFVYRIVKTEARPTDLSGTGAFRTGGRWNNKGTYMLYTSENSSLAYLETLVHFDDVDCPPHLYLMKVEVHDQVRIYTFPPTAYPAQWRQTEHLENKKWGDRWMIEKKFLAIKVKSAVNESEFSYLLNPLFPRFYDLVKVAEVTPIELGKRLID